MLRQTFVLIAAAASAWAGASKSSQALPARSGNALDTVAVHKLYMEGDFDHAIAVVEQALRENKVPTHADSTFAFKHLGVMYAARYETRETGKRYMYQLLQIEPTARIMDMYASDMIYMIFKNIQEEVALKQGDPLPQGKRPLGGQAGPKPKADPSGKKAWPYWTAGAVVTAIGVGVVSYLLVSDGDPAPGTDHGIPH